jgi:hypothetical protein
MVTPELIEYVKNERARGVTDDALRLALQTSGGWALSDIEAALRGDVAVPSNSAAGVTRMTNEAARPATAGNSVLAGPELVAWRARRRNHIFYILSAIALLISAFYLMLDGGLFEFFYIPMIVLIICYGVSSFISRFAKPGKNEGVALVGNVLIAIVIVALISGGLCTAFFMIALSNIHV